MSDWYYARGGQQIGPVSREHLADLLQNGTLNPAKDLVWTSTMKDWLPAAQVPEFAAPTADPYSTPASAWAPPLPAMAGEGLEEIVHGSDPINVTACVKRGFDLTARNFGMILLVGVIYFAVMVGVNFLMLAVDTATGWGHATQQNLEGVFGPSMHFQQSDSPFSWVVKQLVTVFLALGLTRICLNVVSGREFSIGMLFGGGKKFLPALGATILFSLMIFVGFVLFIVPGVYLALRYGRYLTAMVDRDLGVMESFQYSSSLTTGNRLNLFLLALLSIVVFVAGLLAVCVGLFFAIPVIYLAWTVAYRWMQYGYRAAEDHPGTQTPVLSGTIGG